MTRRVFRILPMVGLMTAILIFSDAANVDAKSAGSSGQQPQSDRSKNIKPVNFKAKWNRTQQNIDTHNAGTVQQPKSASKGAKTRHDTVKNSISNIR
jgi:hypothetical protein